MRHRPDTVVAAPDSKDLDGSTTALRERELQGYGVFFSILCLTDNAMIYKGL